MRAKRIVVTAFILGPLVVLVVLCWVLAIEIDRQNRDTSKAPAATAPHAVSHE
jgi:hypothetical protein